MQLAAGTTSDVATRVIERSGTADRGAGAERVAARVVVMPAAIAIRHARPKAAAIRGVVPRLLCQCWRSGQHEQGYGKHHNFFHFTSPS
jgi:hypothetical protein